MWYSAASQQGVSVEHTIPYNAIKKKLGKVTKSDVAELCPSLSISAIEKEIDKMVEEGRLEKMGSGKTTYYVVKL